MSISGIRVRYVELINPVRTIREIKGTADIFKNSLEKCVMCAVLLDFYISGF